MIVGKDANPRTAGEMNFTTLVGSGESYDVLYSADDKRHIYADYIFCGKAGFPSLKQQIAQATEQSIAAGTFIPPFPGATDLWANIILQTGLGQGTFIPPKPLLLHLTWDELCLESLKPGHFEAGRNLIATTLTQVIPAAFEG